MRLILASFITARDAKTITTSSTVSSAAIITAFSAALIIALSTAPILIFLVFQAAFNLSTCTLLTIGITLCLVIIFHTLLFRAIVFRIFLFHTLVVLLVIILLSGFQLMIQRASFLVEGVTEQMACKAFPLRTSHNNATCCWKHQKTPS